MGNTPAPPAQPPSIEPHALLTWDQNVIGLKEAKTSLEQLFFLPRRFPQHFGDDKPKTSALMFWGPPGTGKTLIAQAMAKAHGAELEKLDPSAVLSMWQGQSEARISEFFAKAKKKKTVLFIDEFDGFGSSRRGEEPQHVRTLKSQLLTSMTDLANNNPLDSVVIGCTNLLGEVDDALRRRFDQTIYCGLPDHDEKASLLIFHAGKMNCRLSRADALEITSHPSMKFASGADIERFVAKAAHVRDGELLYSPFFRQEADGRWRPCSAEDPGAQRRSLRDITDEDLGPRRQITKQDFLSCLPRFRATMNANKIVKYRDEKVEVDDVTPEEPRSALEVELSSAFDKKDDAGTAVNTLEAFIAFAALSQDTSTASSKQGAGTLIVALVLVAALTMALPSLLWSIIAVLGALSIASTVFLPLSDMLNAGQGNQAAPLNVERLLPCLVVLCLFLIMLFNNCSFFDYSSIHIINVLVATFFLNMVVSLLGTYANFVVSGQRYARLKAERLQREQAARQRQQANNVRDYEAKEQDAGARLNAPRQRIQRE